MRKLSGVHLNLEHCGGPRALSLVSGDVVKRSTARVLFSPGFSAKMLGNAPLVLPLLDSQGIVKLSTDGSMQFLSQISDNIETSWDLGTGNRFSVLAPGLTAPEQQKTKNL